MTSLLATSLVDLFRFLSFTLRPHLPSTKHLQELNSVIGVFWTSVRLNNVRKLQFFQPLLSFCDSNVSPEFSGSQSLLE